MHFCTGLYRDNGSPSVPAAKLIRSARMRPARNLPAFIIVSRSRFAFRKDVCAVCVTFGNVLMTRKQSVCKYVSVIIMKSGKV